MTPQEHKKAAEELVQSVLAEHPPAKFYGRLADLSEAIASLLHSQAQGLVKEMLERVPEATAPKKDGVGAEIAVNGWNSARSALLEWAKSKNLV